VTPITWFAGVARSFSSLPARRRAPVPPNLRSARARGGRGSAFHAGRRQPAGAHLLGRLLLPAAIEPASGCRRLECRGQHRRCRALSRQEQRSQWLARSHQRARRIGRSAASLVAPAAARVVAIGRRANGLFAGSCRPGGCAVAGGRSLRPGAGIVTPAATGAAGQRGRASTAGHARTVPATAAPDAPGRASGRRSRGRWSAESRSPSG